MEAKARFELARIVARGVVQGVGFRPFVYRLAKRQGLTGWVRNTSDGVAIEIEGPRPGLDKFILDLRKESPPQAHIEDISVEFATPSGYDDFKILESGTRPGDYQPVSPDIATCSLCLQDISTRENRRFRYPFTNCTNCGPRFTIIKNMPYDRPQTTMSAFTMCQDCRREYEDPLDRRFHAQPNACPVCGPTLQLTDNLGKTILCDDPTKKTAILLLGGSIVAIKGLGGFLLACDAGCDDAVQLLRQRKNRPSKPFAVMVRDVEDAAKHCFLTVEEKRLLQSPQCPIVLVQRRPVSSICSQVAPGLRYLGMMLPYTPLHHVLLREAGVPLVMTSGNLSEEPIAGGNDEALERLGPLADYFLLHNRDIHSTYDDSVAMVVDGAPQVLRRARGYAPFPIRLRNDVPRVLACGGEEKNTFCLTRDRHAFVSQHIGDMDNAETLDQYEKTIDLYQHIFRIEPEIIAHDLHPDYASTSYAIRRSAGSGTPALPVQHHHAHIASCLVDCGEDGPVIGVAFDGTGFGPDGKIWGGEFLVADCAGFERVGRLEYLPLPGGSAAIRKPYRTAIGYVLSLLGDEALTGNLPVLRGVDRAEIDAIRAQVRSGLNSPMTSSMGRLFDAVSALAGIRSTVDYEAQAAVDLEMLSYQAAEERRSYPFSISQEGGCNVLHVKEMVAAILEDLLAGSLPSTVGMRFHNTVVEMTVRGCERTREQTGLRRVALSGGCFQNRLLLGKLKAQLASKGFNVLIHRQVPCNDGGISLGQAVIAANKTKGSKR